MAGGATGAAVLVRGNRGRPERAAGALAAVAQADRLMHAALICRPPSVRGRRWRQAGTRSRRVFRTYAVRAYRSDG
jgi:hypothetical protein